MNILLLGSGGREHALAYKISQSPKCSKLCVAPGNVGMTMAKCFADVSVEDFSAIEKLIHEEEIQLLVVGPEVPLVMGLVDYLKAKEDLAHLLIVGPDKAGARLEGSKEFSKNFMSKYAIPTAAYRSFRKGQYDEAVNFLKSLQAPYVLKADGLAAGKGVIISESLEEAESELQELLSGRFGSASECVVIEEFLKGIECSVFVATDGKDYCLLPVAKDYKRIGEGDTGLNTGGMGSVSPVPFADEVFMQKVKEKVVVPTLRGLQTEGIDYRGFIFVGLMNVGGEPYVIEYNCRMGDPETESVMLRLKSDFVDLLCAMAKGDIASYQIEEDERCAATVVMVAKGYPEAYEKGQLMTLPSILNSKEQLFHAGTKADEQANILTNGGRVITASCYGNSLEEALTNCYALVDKVGFEGKTFRRDIGKDLL